MLRIGCHLPSSKGYLEMGKHAVALGATTFAFFTRNPRGGKAKPIQKEDVAAFLAYAAEHDLQHLVAHAPYTMNLCSADPSIRQFGKICWQMTCSGWNTRQTSIIIFIPAAM